MGRSFKRRGSAAVPGDLRDALITAVASNDHGTLARLLRDHRDEIGQRFPSWTTVPDDVRKDAAATGRYAQALITIATNFQQRGDASLMAALTGRPGENPLEQWSRDVEAAQTLIDEDRAGEAVELLATVLAKIDETSGSGAEHLRPRVLGRLGIAHYRAGNTAKAVEVTREARDLCAKAGDPEGVQAYTRNLESMGTLDVPGGPSHETPLNVIVRDESGRTLAFHELSATTGRLTWELRGGPDVPADAKALHERGREAGARGEHDAAIALFTQAAEGAPDWPYPLYDRGFTHVLKGDAARALADYRRTLELAPDGFFTAAQSAAMLEREVAGDWPAGLFATFAIHGEGLQPEQRRRVAAQIVEKYPGFTPAWDALIDLTDDAAVRLELIERALTAGADAQTAAIWRIKKALTVRQLGDTERAASMLKQPAAASDATPATRAHAAMVLQMIAPEGARTVPR